jgi:hypothetical protein
MVIPPDTKRESRFGSDNAKFARKKQPKTKKVKQEDMSSNPTKDSDPKDNLSEIEEEIETSSQYFKPKPDKTYLISMDPQKDKIVPTENDRFKDANGNPLKRYECKIKYVNSGREQKWTVAKTVCLQIIEQLKKNFTVLRVTRHGSDRATTYTIEGMQ